LGYKLARKRVQYLKRDPEGVREMCRISEEIYNEGVERGIEQGIEQGIERGARDRLLENVRSMTKNLKITAQQALDVLDVPKSEQTRLIAML
jgi:flagellar biosynthesis/type III secretory pathway protein FliH